MKKLSPFFLLCVYACVYAAALSGCNFSPNKDDPEPQKKQLYRPINLKFDRATYTLSWDAVPNASGYSVSLYNGYSDFISSAETTNLSLQFAPSIFFGYDGLYRITAISVGSGNYTNSEINELMFSHYRERIRKVENLSYDRANRVLTWRGEFNADSYEIKAYRRVDKDESNDILLATHSAAKDATSTTFTEEEMGDFLSYSFTVEAVSDSLDKVGSISNKYISDTPLATPQLSFDRSTLRLSWPAVPHAAGYTVVAYSTYDYGQSTNISRHIYRGYVDFYPDFGYSNPVTIRWWVAAIPGPDSFGYTGSKDAELNYRR